MKLGAMILSRTPLLRETCRHLVLVVNLVDRHTLVCQIQNLIVQIRIRIPLCTHNLLNSFIPPTWPVMRRDQDLGILTKPIQRLIDLL